MQANNRLIDQTVYGKIYRLMSVQACILYYANNGVISQPIIGKHMRHLPIMVSRVLKSLICMNEEGSKVASLLVCSVVIFFHTSKALLAYGHDNAKSFAVIAMLIVFRNLKGKLDGKRLSVGKY